MSSVHIDQPTKVNQHPSKKENDNNKSRKLFNSSHKKHKYDDNRGGSGGGGCGGGVGTQISNSLIKFGRKRVPSNNGKFFLPYKRRKKEGVIIPPTKFLLGIHNKIFLYTYTVYIVHTYYSSVFLRYILQMQIYKCYILLLYRIAN